MENKYYVLEPALASADTKQENIAAWLAAQNKDFYQAQIAQERDFCFWCRRVETAKGSSLESYSSMAYTLNDPQTLNLAANSSFILNEEETLRIHTLSVVRDGQVIDKMKDINVKVLDHVNGESSGFFENKKNVTVLIRDLHLNDIFIIETTTVRKYKEDSIRNDFFRYSFQFPGTYWVYDEYRFELINETGQTLEGNYHYFRDEADELLEKEAIVIENGSSFTIEEREYKGKEIKEGYLEPFIDFSTQKSFPEITEALDKIYQKYYEVDLTSFAPELIEALEKQPSLEHKIKYAVDFVQKEIYYLYNESEMDGHEPQAAEVTYTSKQGDCKAKTLLLKVILDYLGVASQIALVGYSADIFLPVYTPSPFIFSHAILKVYHGGQIYFVDATIENDQGFLGKRRKDSFMYYLELVAGTDLQNQKPFVEALPEVEEVIHCDVVEDTATFSLKGIYRGGLANRMRASFKNQTNKDILNNFSVSVHNNMALYNKYKREEIDNYFSDASIQLVSDDKETNELEVLYKATISEPYLKDGKNRILHYWDRTYFVNDEAKNHTHKDFPLWVDRNSVKMEIHLTTDGTIDQQDRYTRKECNLTSTYLNHKTSKKLSEHSASCYLDYQAYRNLPLSGDELKEYIKINDEITDNNWGIGIDIVQEGLFKKITRLFGGK